MQVAGWVLVGMVLVAEVGMASPLLGLSPWGRAHVPGANSSPFWASAGGKFFQASPQGLKQ